jgi:hypothetical protein
VVKHHIALAGALVLSACRGYALSYSADLGQTYSGTSPASAESPWLRATFEDISGGKVRLTMEALNLTANEFVGVWTFNLNPAYSPSSLYFAAAPTDPGQAGIDSIAHSPSGLNYKAGPEKYFDIKFDMENSAGPGRFTSGERLVYDIGLTGGSLTAEDFLFRNQKSGSLADDWFSAAHVQAIGAAGQSGWIGATVIYENEDPPLRAQAVPDTGQTIVILGAACLGLAALKRSQKRE